MSQTANSGKPRLRKQVREHTSVSDQLETYRKDLRLSDRDLADLASVSTSTIRRWRVKGPDRTPDPIDRLRAITLSLASSNAQPAEIGRWLGARNRALGFSTPLQLLRDEDPKSLLEVARAADAFAEMAVLPESAPPERRNSDDHTEVALTEPLSEEDLAARGHGPQARPA